MACCTVFGHYRMLVILVVTGIYDKSKLDLEVLVLFWGFFVLCHHLIVDGNDCSTLSVSHVIGLPKKFIICQVRDMKVNLPMLAYLEQLVGVFVACQRAGYGHRHKHM